MKKKIIISSVVLFISLILLITPTIYLSNYDSVPSIDYLASSLVTVIQLLPFYIVGTIGMVFSVKKFFEMI